MRFIKNSLVFTSLILLVSSWPAYATERERNRAVCSNTARLLWNACQHEVADDYFKGRANCINITDRQARKSCMKAKQQLSREAWQACKEVKHARKELCDAVGEARYDPAFGKGYAANFVNPLEIGNSVIPNPYFPLVPGTQWVYEGIFLDDEGAVETENITVTVTDKTKLIQGINCIVVNDVVSVGNDDFVIEDTDDWYAQDLQGNVWYCGEIAQNFELFEGDDPEDVELIDVEGSWKAGRENAKAGILIPANPVVGDVIRQEVFWGDAEDVIEIISLTGSETVPAAACLNDCLVTKDFTPLAPGVAENKYYAPGVGTILEIDIQTGDRLELIKFSRP